MNSLQYENSPLDKTDDKILSALSENARITTAALARLVGLSAPSVSERVKRLEEAGVIQGYTITINPAAFGRPISAWLRIRPTPGNYKKVVEVITNISEIVECDRITGDDCFVARAHVSSMQELERVIDQLTPYGVTNTSIIQSSPIAPRMPPRTTSA